MINHKHEKILLLEQVKTLVETSLQLILSTKESAGNIKNIQWHKIVENNSDLFIRTVEKLVQTFEQQSSSVGVMNHLSESLRKLISTLDTTMISNQGQFMDYQVRMIEILRQIAKTVQEIHSSDSIRQLANRLTCEYNELVNATYGAIGTANTNELAGRIRNIVKELGLVIVELIEKLAENYSKHDLESSCQKVIEKVGRFSSEES